MPRAALYLHLAREFGGWPEDYRNKPFDELAYWIELLGIEGDVARDWADDTGGVDDHVFFD